MPNGIAFSAQCPNYSGALYLRGNAATPLLALIGAKRRYQMASEFTCGQSYSLADAEIPHISAADSVNAPAPTFVTRKQDTNVTQIFQKSLVVPYEKESNMGLLNGLNVAGQAVQPTSELQFQIEAKLRETAKDIEKTFIQGVYHKALNETDANQTRGLIDAIRSNVVDLADNELSVWDVADLLSGMGRQGAPTDGLVLWCDNVTRFQLAAEAEANSYRVVTAADTVSGINITSILTPAGTVRLVSGMYLHAGTALILNLSVLAPVEQIVPGKGNFFVEDIAKSGAAEKKQLFGQAGLDHGPEWMHGKITGIKKTYTRPVKKVYVTGSAPIPTYATEAPAATLAFASLGVGGIATPKANIPVNVGFNGTVKETDTVQYDIIADDVSVGTMNMAASAPFTFMPSTYGLGPGQTVKVVASMNGSSVETDTVSIVAPVPATVTLSGDAVSGNTIKDGNYIVNVFDQSGVSRAGDSVNMTMYAGDVGGDHSEVITSGAINVGNSLPFTYSSAYAGKSIIVEVTLNGNIGDSAEYTVVSANG